tara:strand:+ start:297 stop:563 length:267 start_codon:yes stop_codon:yes gene_type:complete
MSKKYKYYSGLYYGNNISPSDNGDIIVFRRYIEPNDGVSWHGNVNGTWLTFYFSTDINAECHDPSFDSREFTEISDKEAMGMVFVEAV